MLNVGLAIDQQTDDLVTTLKTCQGQRSVLVCLNLQTTHGLLHRGKSETESNVTKLHVLSNSLDYCCYED